MNLIKGDRSVSRQGSPQGSYRTYEKGANVPTYVLEYLLGMYCTTDDDDEMRIGLDKIKKILSENYVRPDQSDYVKSKIKENGQYTVIDKVTVRLDEKRISM